MNIAYKHLDARLRLAELTVAQWAVVLLGLVVGLMWIEFLSPFSSLFLTAMIGVYVGTMPAAAAVFAGYTEFDLALFVRTAIAWRRQQGRYAAGPGAGAQGYVIVAEPVAGGAQRTAESVLQIDIAGLWDS